MGHRPNAANAGKREGRDLGRAAKSLKTRFALSRLGDAFSPILNVAESNSIPFRLLSGDVKVVDFSGQAERPLPEDVSLSEWGDSRTQSKSLTLSACSLDKPDSRYSSLLSTFRPRLTPHLAA